MKKFVPTELRKCADVYEDRNKIYGASYHVFGSVMLALFPNGLVLKTEEDFNRIGVFAQKISKLTRYAAQYETGGHDDSLSDDAVYSVMMLELDKQARTSKAKLKRRKRS